MPQTPHVERHFTASEIVRDTVIGMADGLTVPFALAAGLSGAVQLVLRDPVMTREDDPWSKARLHALLFDRQATLSNLEKSYATHANIAFLNVTPEFEFVRDDPRFRDLLKKLRLDSVSASR